ncbi:MAG TPA: MarC family protein [Dehalococcoidia bacterium]|nr:MarC family protein [Dehalococcoidia bacterium]
MGEDFSRAFISYFAIIDPIGNAFVFYLLTEGLSYSKRLFVAITAVLAAGMMLALFAVAGQEVLDILGISAESFKVAAGLLLLFPAYRLVEQGQPMHPEEQQHIEPAQVALVPLATPLMAGPGALATSISFSDSLGIGITVGAMVPVLALSFILYASAGGLLQWLGPSPLRLLARIVGILLFAIAVDFILEGLRDFYQW